MSDPHLPNPGREHSGASAGFSGQVASFPGLAIHISWRSLSLRLHGCAAGSMNVSGERSLR